MEPTTLIPTVIAIMIGVPGAIVSVLTLIAHMQRQRRHHRHKEPSNPDAA